MSTGLIQRVVSRPLAIRLRRFVLVGAVAAAIQTVLLSLFVERANLNYLVAAAVAIEITILFQYVLNNAYTFRERRNDGRHAFLRGLLTTNLVRGSAIPIQLGVLYALVEGVSMLYLVANGVAIVVSGCYRYALDARFTWGE